MYKPELIISQKKRTILYIWHAAVVAEYRKKLKALAALPGTEVTLLIPSRWREGGRTVQYEYCPDNDAGYAVAIGKIAHTNNIRRYYFLNNIITLLRRVKPDIIDIEEEPYAYCTAQVVFFNRILGVNAKVLFHSAHIIEKRMDRRFEALQRHVFKKAAAAIFRNQQTERYLRGRGYQGTAYYCGNGFDLSTFTPGHPQKSTASTQSTAKYVVGYVGKLISAKGVLDLWEAFTKLPSHFSLLLVGDGDLRAVIHTKARKMGIEDRLLFTGAVDHSAVPEYYRKMDVCVIPSRTTTGWRETFGRTIIEAMACGVPVIGSSSGAIPETIADNGMLFPEGDVDSLSRKIVEVCSNVALRNALIEKGLKRAREFSWENIAKIHDRIYRDIMQ